MLAGMYYIILVISIAVIVCFAFVYGIMFSLYYFSRKKAIEHKLEDDIISKQLDKDIAKFETKKISKTCLYPKYYYKKKKSRSNWNILGNSILAVLFVIMVVGFIFAMIIKGSNQAISIKGVTYYVIETGSMEEVNQNNDYLINPTSDNEYINTRINQYSLVGIEDYTDVSQLEVYDIVAFEMDGKVVVHRLLAINHQEDGSYTFTFRGDANRYSLSGEIGVSEDRIIGVYNGYQSFVLGSLIVYLQSGIGLITIFAIIIVMSMYSYYYDKLEAGSKKRYEVLMNERYRLLPYFTYQKDCGLTYLYLDSQFVLEVENQQEVEDEIVSKEIEDKQEIQPSKESKEVENNEDKLEETEIEPVSVVEEPEPAFEDNNDIELVSPIIKDSRYDLYQTTHLAKLALAEDEARIRYNEVKNIIMSYKNMTCRFGKRFESFNVSRNKLFVLSIRNKNVTLYLNLDPSSLDPKYFIEDVSNIRKYASYPSKLVIKSNRGVKYAEELIEQAAIKFNIEKKKRKSYVDYLALYPKQTEDELIKSGEMYKRKN